MLRTLRRGRPEEHSGGSTITRTAAKRSRACRAEAPEARRRVRVKWCGKSAPRFWQQKWQAKPRTEQDQIGRRLRAARPRSPGRLLDPASNGRARGMVVAPKLAVRRAKANRIRLIGLTAALSSRCPRAARSARRSLASLTIVALAAIAVTAQDLGIRQYKPKSTLVVAAHPVPRAKYPVIDVHSHHFELSAERWATVVREMDGLNLRLLVNLSGGTVRSCDGRSPSSPTARRRRGWCSSRTSTSTI